MSHWGRFFFKSAVQALLVTDDLCKAGTKCPIWDTSYLTNVPISSPLTALTIFSGSAIPNTNNGILLSLHNAVAVESITFKSFSNTSKYDILSYFSAFLSILGSAEYTASIAFPSNIISAFISVALNTAAVSVVKYGCPVPHANITTLPLCKCFSAFLIML